MSNVIDKRAECEVGDYVPRQEVKTEGADIYTRGEELEFKKGEMVFEIASHYEPNGERLGVWKRVAASPK